MIQLNSCVVLFLILPCFFGCSHSDEGEGQAKNKHENSWVCCLHRQGPFPQCEGRTLFTSHYSKTEKEACQVPEDTDGGGSKSVVAMEKCETPQDPCK